jgi:hypothetical protein
MKVCRSKGAMYAFKALGVKAQREIGSLSRIANDPRSRSRTSATWVLGEMGVAALPAIVGILTNEQNRTVKSRGVLMVCATTIYSLASDDPTTARLAQPSFLSMCEDPDPEIRLHATNTLRILRQSDSQMFRRTTNY